MIYDFIIIGGGASGVSAAISYKKNNPDGKVLILEGLKDILRKVQISGNGKGNFTNEFINSDSYSSPDFVKEVIGDHPLNEVLSFFDSLSMSYKKDMEGRFYPLSDRSDTIVYVMKRELENLKVEIHLEEKVLNVTKENENFEVFTTKATYFAKNVLISTGGKNYPSLGSDGSMYPIITAFKHHLTPIFPANVYIKIKEKNISKRLSGQRFKATLYLVNDKKVDYFESGELLFKDDALSGIVAFNVSNHLAYLYKNGSINEPYIMVDFLPQIDSKEIIEKLGKATSLLEGLMGIVGRELANIINDYAKTIEEATKLLTSFPFTVTSLGDFDHAQVTSGGVRTIEIKPNLESIIVPRLFFAGDVIDVDSVSGGYNLSFAFLSGIKAGRSIYD